MKDFLGNEINVGAEVVIIRPEYRELVLGTVVSFTPKFVNVRYALHYDKNRFDTHRVAPQCLIVK